MVKYAACISETGVLSNHGPLTESDGDVSLLFSQSEDFEVLSASQSFSDLLTRVKFGLFNLETSNMANITYSTFNVATTVKKNVHLKKVSVCAALKMTTGIFDLTKLKI